LTPGAFDPLRALRTLSRHDVRYVVIGGLGARLHGSPSVTNDTDVCCQRAPANLERLAAALRQLHAGLRGADGDAPFQLDAKTLDGLTVAVASIEDLISMKRAAGRPKDLIEVEVLGALRDEVAQRAREPGA